MSRIAAISRKSFGRLPHWLALFAVLVQLVASFGHVHSQDYRFLFQGHGTPLIKADNGLAGGGSLPVPPADRDCAICASAQLLGSSALPDAVVVGIPRLENLAVVTAGEELWLTPPSHLLSSSRAPPLV